MIIRDNSKCTAIRKEYFYQNQALHFSLFFFFCLFFFFFFLLCYFIFVIIFILSSIKFSTLLPFNYLPPFPYFLALPNKFSSRYSNFMCFQQNWLVELLARLKIISMICSENAIFFM